MCLDVLAHVHPHTLLGWWVLIVTGVPPCLIEETTRRPIMVAPSVSTTPVSPSRWRLLLCRWARGGWPVVTRFFPRLPTCRAITVSIRVQVGMLARQVICHSCCLRTCMHLGCGCRCRCGFGVGWGCDGVWVRGYARVNGFSCCCDGSRGWGRGRC